MIETASTTTSPPETHRLSPSSPTASRARILDMRHLPRLTQRAPRSLETRRNKFIPDASRVAIDRIAAQTKLMKVERDGVGKEPAWGRVNEAFLALIGLVPPPTAREDVELVEFALEALRLIHPERAALLGAWWRERPNQGA